MKACGPFTHTRTWSGLFGIRCSDCTAISLAMDSEDKAGLYDRTNDRHPHSNVLVNRSCGIIYLKVSRHSVVRTSHRRTDPSDEALRAVEPSLVNITLFTNDVCPLSQAYHHQ